MYLRAVCGSQYLAGEEFTRARLRILDAMAEQIASEGPVRVSNKWVPARPHSARRWAAIGIPAGAFVALIVVAGLFSNVWLAEKRSATDRHAALAPLTTQDKKTDRDASVGAPWYRLTTQDWRTNPGTSHAAEGGPWYRLTAQDWKTYPGTSPTAPRYAAEGGRSNGDSGFYDVLAYEFYRRIANEHASEQLKDLLPPAPSLTRPLDANVSDDQTRQARRGQ